MANVLREKIRKEGKERGRSGGREEERERKEGKKGEGRRARQREKNKYQEHPAFLSILAIIELCAFGQVRLL